jgi:ABC-2 type transport system ATP-binding protein
LENSIISSDEQSKRGELPLERLLEVRGISKHFGARRALEEFSLAMNAGEIVGLVGSNGSGKTTALRALAGLLQADSGSGAVLGFNLFRDAAQIRRRVGYLSQRDSLYSTLTVRENLSLRAKAFGLRDPARIVSAAIEQFRLHPFAEQRADRLSGGWARTLQLAIALVHEPKVVMLDEPAAGLDLAARQVVWRHLTRLASEGRTLLMSTHDLLDASRCSRIVLLSKGRVRACGRPCDLVCATEFNVLAILGPRALTLVDLLQTIPGVITSYPSGASLRALVRPTAQQSVTTLAEAHDFSVERVHPTLEDAFLGLAQPEIEATTDFHR